MGRRMTENEIVFWIYVYQVLAIVFVIGWCISAIKEMRRERKLKALSDKESYHTC